MKPILYFVGEPYPLQDVNSIFGELGYRIGIIKDRRKKIKYPELFEHIIEADFDRPEEIANQCGPELSAAAGLICTYENYVIAKAHIAAALNLPSLSIESAMLCTDKAAMRQAFAKYDPNITPQYVEVACEDDILQKTSHLTYPLMFKPANLVKSLFVTKCHTPEQLKRTFTATKDKIEQAYLDQHIYGRKPHFVVEEFMEGHLYSVAAFVDIAGRPHFCQGVASLANGNERGHNDNFLYSRILPANLNQRQQDEIFRVAEAGVRALNMTSSPAHIEIIFDGAKAKIVEIGARIGGYRPRMYKLSYGINMFEQEVLVCTGKQPRPGGDFRQYCGVYELFPQSQGKLSHITNFSPEKYTYTSRKTMPGMQVGPAKDGYKAACFIIVSSPDAGAFSTMCAEIDNMEVIVS